MEQRDRAVTPVVSTILMVAIVIILAATTSVFFLDFAEDINEPAPNIGDTTGEFVIDDPSAFDNQIVRITHVAGDSVPVEEIEIIVRASGSGSGLPTQTRLIELPSDDTTLDQNNIQGDDIIDEGGDDRVVVEDVPADNNIWEAGETIQFRIQTGGADFRIEEENTGPRADELEVIIVHTPSDAIISEHTFTP